jgi:ribonuclease P protein component
MAGFQPQEHIRQRVEFQRVYDHGSKTHGRYATVFILSTNREWARLGIAASRKMGGAVARNRAKRLIREAFRLNKPAAGFDIVVVPKRELLEAGLSALETEYRNILAKHLRRPRGPVAHRSL